MAIPGLSQGILNAMNEEAKQRLQDQQLADLQQQHEIQAFKMQQAKQAIIDNAKMNTMRGTAALGSPTAPAAAMPSQATPAAAPAPAPGTPSVPMTHPAAAPIPPYKTVRGTAPTPTAPATPAAPPATPPAAQQPVLPTDKTTQKVSTDVTQTFGLTPGRMHTDAVLLKKEGFSNADIGAYLAKNLPYYKLVDTENANMIHMKMEEELRRQNYQHQQVMEKQGQERIDAMKNQGTNVSPEALDVMANRFINGEPLNKVAPGYGKQGVAVRNAVSQRATQILQASHPDWTPGQIANALSDAQSTYKTSTQALGQMQKDTSAFTAYSNMLDKNISVIKKLQKKIASTNSTLLNKPINWLRQHAYNDPNVSEYLAQIEILTTESARVLNNPRLVGQLTVEQKREIKDVLSGNMPFDATNKVLERFANDSHNRMNAMNAQLNALRKNLQRGKGKQTPTTKTKSKVVNWNDLK